MRKNEALQILRAVAALLVVNRHALEVVRLHQSGGPMNSYSLDKFGAVGVDIFFAISGFILSTVILRAEAATPRLAFDFLVRRFTRIFPIYWILSLFFLVLAATHKLFTSKWVIDSYLLLPSGYPLRAPLLLFGWTLMFEMFFYYVISFNLLFGKQAAIPRTITSILLLVGIGAIVGFQKPVLILIANPINVEFVLGCFVALLHANFGKRPAVGLALLLSGRHCSRGECSPGIWAHRRRRAHSEWPGELGSRPALGPARRRRHRGRRLWVGRGTIRCRKICSVPG